MTEAEQQAGDFPEAWKPEPGDSIKGTVSRISMSPDFGYGPYPIVTLKTDEGVRAVHAMHHVLRTELARRKPRKDDELEITYQGKRSPRSGSGNPFHVYAVEGGNEPEFNWDSELPAEERQREPVAAAQAAPAAQVPSTPNIDADLDLPF